MFSNLLIILGVGVSGGVVVLILLFLFLHYLDLLVFPKLSFPEALGKGNLAVAIFLGSLAAAFILGLFMYASSAIGADYSRYDDYFRRSTKLVWGYEPCHATGRVCDWRIFKAQGITESALKHDVCSHVGACGVMQFMPGTAKHVGLVNRFEAKESIYHGIKYDHYLWQEWTAPRPVGDRLSLALASYNAGLGHVLNAQKRSQGAALFAKIAPYLWAEPREYVERIKRWHKRLAPRELWDGAN